MQKVVSKDGTEIAYDVTGNGPGPVLIAGAFTGRAYFRRVRRVRRGAVADVHGGRV
ncbi:hypothetical protein [Kribbella solani]|uniref:Alpha/beta hydrolase n=1 Tax=Kribbella solani TaxID=236067 RepID=A0A841DKX0_9ACTN|nr:hypothetical protein [Kribbella solani]MBB5979764.1 hypothetical protein [Kribbella solani]